MNSKVAAFTVSEKSINTNNHLSLYCHNPKTVFRIKKIALYTCSLMDDTVKLESIEVTDCVSTSRFPVNGLGITGSCFLILSDNT